MTNSYYLNLADMFFLISFHSGFGRDRLKIDNWIS